MSRLYLLANVYPEVASNIKTTPINVEKLINFTFRLNTEVFVMRYSPLQEYLQRFAFL